MRIDRSLNNIDITKLTIFSLVFIIFMLIMVFSIAMPTIDKYKQASEINSEKKINLTKIEQIYNENLSVYENLKSEHQRALNVLKNSFNEMKFISMAGRYFNNVYLSRPTILNDDPRYIINQVSVSAQMKNPQNLYDFINDLRNYDSLINVNFPIEMKSKDDYIETSFVIKIYQER